MKLTEKKKKKKKKKTQTQTNKIKNETNIYSLNKKQKDL